MGVTAAAGGDAAVVPAGTVADILTWVGGDPVRAAAAFAAEQAARQPRVTLLRSLQELL